MRKNKRKSNSVLSIQNKRKIHIDNKLLENEGGWISLNQRNRKNNKENQNVKRVPWEKKNVDFINEITILMLKRILYSHDGAYQKFIQRSDGTQIGKI